MTRYGRPARTLLEQLIRERLHQLPQTWAELVRDFNAEAEERREDVSITERHLRRLASGERTDPYASTRRVLQRLFNRSTHDLLAPPGATSPSTELVVPDSPTLTSGSTAPPLASSGSKHQVTPQLVQSLAQIFVGYVQTDRLLGPKPLIDVVQHQAHWVEQLADNASYGDRAELLPTVVGFTEFAGWIAHDAGNYNLAMWWTNRALDYAAEYGDPRTIGYVMMRRSNIAVDAGRTGEGLSLAESALRNRAELTPRLRAVALRQRANAFALAGDSTECARSLDDAMTELDRQGDSEASSTYCNPGYVTPAYLEMEAAGAWLQLDQPERAVPILERGLRDWPSNAPDERDRGMLLARLANAHASAGDLDAACAYGQQALTVVSAAHSTRAVTQLRQISTRIAGQSSLAVVRDFNDAVTQLNPAQ